MADDKRGEARLVRAHGRVRTRSAPEEETTILQVQDCEDPLARTKTQLSRCRAEVGARGRLTGQPRTLPRRGLGVR